ncbi:alkene reductase, partial [Phenylobacterium sp.]|uniref:oxidoreductase n=1 Tax=Phenylobacterium sp. TaxID=1871053 RepID=UPI002E3146C1
YPEPMGKGYIRTPGIADEAQVRAWRKVTDAVHAEGGRIAAQIMHAGRISLPNFLPGRATPVAPYAVQPSGSGYTDEGMKPHPLPRALEVGEIVGIVEGFARATERALRAGFDAVELHGGGGYLPMQFLSSGTNLRTDGYGGGLGARSRFMLEVLEAMVSVAGPHRVGLKLTPEMPYNEAIDATPAETYSYVVRAADSMGLAFLEVGSYGESVDYHDILRPLFSGAYFRGVGLTPPLAAQVVEWGEADAAIFGQAFIANPDLPDRIQQGAALADADPATFYTPGPHGYIDYPALPASVRRVA